ncbi:hypothetical protein N7462_004465 [Penicillium macrosclerotiorum]|uniref:uncharacterized protein n=1 Tax=Penicillium macrosclerotiorum TaxID=303699 RepID=UPI002548C869|nr:uncharacterized protein N7462_004465 [Penicillium macrosclerotiorum]KAJ5690073.1 hypothetical protein N7462_004465 [Penicillium macrosclerotiorum]
MSTKDHATASTLLESSSVSVNTPGSIFQCILGTRTDMSEDPGVQFVGARSKRTHRQMSQESSDGSQMSWHHHFHPPRPNTSSSRPARLPPMRTPRDGFDFRRPAEVASQTEDVIDLTNEPETPPQHTRRHSSDIQGSTSSRLPRFGRNIMAETDIVDLEVEPDHTGEGPSSSPEVQFVRATVRQPPRRWDPLSLLPTNFPLGARSQHPHDMHRLAPLDRTLPRALQRAHRQFMPNLGDSLFIGSSAGLPPIDVTNEVILDYAVSSFAMDPLSRRQEERRQRDRYKAPSPAPAGFTRTLGEDDIAICPNCNWELGTGDGKRQEIWVAKPCGHVYCGECAENRSLSKAKKAQTAQRTKPFSKCQVEGCGKQVSAPTAMLHLYL